MALGLNSRHLNADNTHYVVPLRTQKVPKTLVLSDTIEAIYDITDATGGTHFECFLPEGGWKAFAQGYRVRLDVGYSQIQHA